MANTSRARAVPDINELHWTIILEPYVLANGSEHFFTTIVVTAPGGDPIQTELSPHCLITDRIYETYRPNDMYEEMRLFDIAAKEMKAALDKNPIPFSKEEIQKLNELKELFTPVCPEAHRLGLEVVTALHWETPLVMAGRQDWPPFQEDLEGYDPDEPFACLAQVVHQQPFPEFPFFGFTQLWRGERLSVAVDRDPKTDLLRVVTLAGDDPPHGVRDYHSLRRFHVLHVPDVFFRLAIESEAKEQVLSIRLA